MKGFFITCIEIYKFSSWAQSKIGILYHTIGSSGANSLVVKLIINIGMNVWIPRGAYMVISLIAGNFDGEISIQIWIEEGLEKSESSTFSINEFKCGETI